MKYFFSILIFLSVFPEIGDPCNCTPIENWKRATAGEFKGVELVFIGDVERIEENVWNMK